MLQPHDIAARIERALRVLVVEDSFMTARAIASMLQDLGAEVLGPVPSVQKALAVLDQGRCDAAVLDINLGNETVEPVAKRLEETGLPYFFVSGYASPKSMLQDSRYRKRRLLPKPVEPIMFSEAIVSEFQSSAAPPSPPGETGTTPGPAAPTTLGSNPADPQPPSV